MNAKELHDLIAPLWARVPETRPTDNRDDYLDIDPEFPACFAWMHKCENPCCKQGKVRAALAKDAENAIRVAVEDWLLSRGERPHLTRNFDASSYIVRLRVGSEAQAGFQAPTLLHALVAAAHAVAGPSPSLAV